MNSDIEFDERLKTLKRCLIPIMIFSGALSFLPYLMGLGEITINEVIIFILLVLGFSSSIFS